MKTTLNQIRKHNPCDDSWKELLLSLNKTEADDEPLPLRYILDTLDIQDAIWALRSLEGADREIRLFACECVMMPVYEAKYPEDTRPRNAIKVARRYANGEATEQELDEAAADADAAWAADAARAAAWAAEGAAEGAAAAERAAQKELFIKYFCR